MQVIGLHIGGSFAEASVWAKGESQPRSEKLFYLPRHNLKTALPAFLRTLSEQNFTAAFVTSRHLERLFEFRLGGSTAQLVTQGFEKWPFLNAAPLRTGTVCPVKSHPISSMELTFAIDERVEADGTVSRPLDLAALAPVAEKLKLMQIKRVCVHFAHAHLNPSHERSAASFLRENGFEVWTPPAVDLPEGSRWRASTLEASFSGTFEEMRSDVVTALADFVPEDAIRIHDARGFRPFAEASKVGTLFGDDVLLSRELQGRPALRLDLESWSLLDGEASDEWMSPWGPVACASVKRRPLVVQPTCAMESCGGGVIGPAERGEGFEPGPLSMGRGQKLMVFDLWATDPGLRELLGEQMPEAARTRREAALLAFSRDSQSRSKDVFEKQIRNDVEEWIRTDVALQTGAREILKTGRMAGALSGLSDFKSVEVPGAAGRAARAGLESAR